MIVHTYPPLHRPIDQGLFLNTCSQVIGTLNRETSIFCRSPCKEIFSISRRSADFYNRMVIVYPLPPAAPPKAPTTTATRNSLAYPPSSCRQPQPSLRTTPPTRYYWRTIAPHPTPPPTAHVNPLPVFNCDAAARGTLHLHQMVVVFLLPLATSSS